MLSWWSIHFKSMSTFQNIESGILYRHGRCRCFDFPHHSLRRHYAINLYGFLANFFNQSSHSVDCNENKLNIDKENIKKIVILCCFCFVCANDPFTSSWVVRWNIEVNTSIFFCCFYQKWVLCGIYFEHWHVDALFVNFRQIKITGIHFGLSILFEYLFEELRMNKLQF